MSNGIRNTSIYLFANILNAAIPLLLLPVLTRLLSPEDYGLVAMFGVVLSFFIAICGFGTHGAVTVRYFQLSTDDMREYVFSCFMVVFISSLLLGLSIYLLGDLLQRITLLPQSWLWIALLIALLQFVITVFLALLQAQKKAVTYGVFQVSLSLLNAILSLIIIYYVAQIWESRVLGQVLATTLIALVCIHWIVKNKWISVILSVKWLKDCLSFGLPLMPHILANVVVSLADRTIVANLLGEKDVGIYSVGLQLGLAMSFLSSAFIKAYSPVIYGLLASQTELSKLKVVGMTYLCAIGFPLAIIPIYLLISFFYPWLVGPEYRESFELVIWFLIGHAFTGIYYSISNLYLFAGKTGRLSAISVCVGITTVFLSYLGIAEYGLIGGAFTFCISQLLLLVLVFSFSIRVLPLPWHQCRQSLRAVCLA